AAAGGGPMNWTVAVWVSVTPSAVAVNVTFSMVPSVTVNKTAPLLTDETPLAGVMTAWLPGAGESVTVFPVTVPPLASRSDTTRDAPDEPSAETVPKNGTAGLGKEEMDIEEREASAGPATSPARASSRRFSFGEPRPTC